MHFVKPSEKRRLAKKAGRKTLEERNSAKWHPNGELR